MRKIVFRRILSFLLCVLCVFSMIPESAFAFSEGGTTANGFLKAPEMSDDGDISFTLEASKATNTTKWKTVGFYITTKITEKSMDIFAKCGSLSDFNELQQPYIVYIIEYIHNIWCFN